MQAAIVVASMCALAACAEQTGGPPSEPPACPGELEVCRIHDGGWDVRCEQGVVQVDDLTAVYYCWPTDSDVLCQTGGAGDVYEVHRCASGSCRVEARYFDTYQEYSAFDPSTMCEP